MNFKGSLPLLILHLLSQRPAHGYRIAREIKRRSEGVLDFAEGTLYPTLHNMEKQGLIEAFEEEEKGRTRRYYRLTETGRQALARERGEWERYTCVVNLILEDAS
jgi:PadR family transcriptional regulator PadR